VTTRQRRTTTQRGLGSPHQKTRVQSLTDLRDGDPCARCELRGVYHPMWRSLVTWKNGKPTSRWLDLDDFPGRVYGGPQVKRLSWRKCNRRAGQRITTMILRMRTPRPVKYDRW
jgi:hypothetical protein